MRIVAGKYRGKKLSSPLDENTRPTLDKTRESVFNIIGMKVIDSTCLDLFAGSGALGIEAISRGAKKVVLNDAYNKAIKVIQENVNSLKDLECEVIVSQKDYDEFLDNNDIKFDIVFLDPPYALKVNEYIVNKMIEKNMINENAVFIVETTKEDNFNINYEFSKVKEYRYGKTKLTVLWM